MSPQDKNHRHEQFGGSWEGVDFYPACAPALNHFAPVPQNVPDSPDQAATSNVASAPRGNLDFDTARRLELLASLGAHV